MSKLSPLSPFPIPSLLLPLPFSFLYSPSTFPFLPFPSLLSLPFHVLSFIPLPLLSILFPTLSFPSPISFLPIEVVGRMDCRWLSADAREAKRSGRRREYRYRKAHSSADKLAFQAARDAALDAIARSRYTTPAGSVLTTSPATQRLPGERYAMCCTETIDQSTVTISVGRYHAASVSTSQTSWNAFTSRSPPAFSSSQNLTTTAAGTPARRCPSSRPPLPTKYSYTRY